MQCRATQVLEGGPTAEPSSSTVPPSSLEYPTASAYPSIGAPMSVPTAPVTAPILQPTYTEIKSSAYPSMNGISATKFHEEIKIPEKQKVKTSSKTSYPKFNDNGDID